MAFFNPDIAITVLVVAGVLGLAFLVAVGAAIYLLCKHLFTEH